MINGTEIYASYECVTILLKDSYVFFRDASFGACTYNLSLADVLSGLYKVRNFLIPFGQIHQLKNKY